MTRHHNYSYSLSVVYCSMLIIGSLRCNTAFLPSSKYSILQHSALSIEKQITKESITSLRGEKPNNNKHFNNTQLPSNEKTPPQYKSRSSSFSHDKRADTKRRDNDIGSSNSQFMMYKKLNWRMTECNDASELLTLLGKHSNSAISKIAGDGAFNDVNLSTAFYRFASFLSEQPRQQKEGRQEHKRLRSQILSDPRFALLVCCIAEAFCNQGNYIINFGPRQLASIAWSISKLKIAPPKEAYPLEVSLAAFPKTVKKCSDLRRKVYEVARDRTYNKFVTSTVPWIPDLAQLCGNVVDMISYKASRILDPSDYRFQECSNIMWAVATIERADLKMMTNVVDNLVTLSENRAEKLNANNGESIQQRHMPQSERLKPQVLSNSLWSLAKSLTFGPDEKLIQLTAKLFVTLPSFLDEADPQNLSNIVWSVATLLSKRPVPASDETNYAALVIMRFVSKEVIKNQGEKFKSQTVCNIAWALATVGFGIVPTTTKNINDSVELQSVSPTSYNMVVILSSNDPIGDHNIMSGAIKTLVERGNQILHYFKPQELGNMVWAMARLDQKDDIFLSRVGWELANSRQYVQPQSCSMTLWALARLEFFDKAMYTKIVERFIKYDTRLYKSQEICNVLFAIAKADLVPTNLKVFETTIPQEKRQMPPQNTIDDPITACYALAAQALMSRPSQYETHGICSTLLSIVKAGIRHPNLFRSVAAHFVGQTGRGSSKIRDLRQFSPQGISIMAWTYARHAQIGSESLTSYNLPLLSGRLAIYTISALDVGEGLLQRLFSGLANVGLRLHGNLSLLLPMELDNAIWSFALLGLKHDAYLDEAQTQVLDRLKSYFYDNRRNPMTTFVPQGVTNLLWGMGTLSKRLIPGLMDAVSLVIVEHCTDPETGEITISNIKDKMHRQGLGTLAWACAAHDQYPSDIIKIIYMGLLGVGCDKPIDPKYLTDSVYNDNGLEIPVIISLLYLHVAMDLDGKNNGMVSLPKDYPHAWVSSKNPKNEDNNNNDNSRNSNRNRYGLGEMTIISSKTQQEVASALDRIGFDHIEEYVMDMEMLVNEYGVNGMTASSFEVLSIDIANVKEKIAIEVDGPAHYLASLNAIKNPNKPTTSELNAPRNEAVTGGRLEYNFSYWNRRELNGATMLKHRILEKLGWKVVSINIWDWYKLSNDKEKEDAFCRKLLALHI